MGPRKPMIDRGWTCLSGIRQFRRGVGRDPWARNERYLSGWRGRGEANPNPLGRRLFGATRVATAGPAAGGHEGDDQCGCWVKKKKKKRQRRSRTRNAYRMLMTARQSLTSKRGVDSQTRAARRKAEKKKQKKAAMRARQVRWSSISPGSQRHDDQREAGKQRQS